MATSVPIKERILRRLAVVCSSVAGVGTVYRWDARGLAQQAPYDIIISCGEAKARLGEAGSLGTTVKSLEVYLHTILPNDEQSGATTTDAILITWQAKMEAALLADPYLTEVGGARLARNASLYVSSESGVMLAENGVPSCITTVTLDYEQNYNSPYIGPGIALLEE